MAAIPQETAQATAHTLRPIAVAHQAASTVARFANTAKNALQSPDDVLPEGGDLSTFIWGSVQQIEELARYSLMAVADATDCVASIRRC